MNYGDFQRKDFGLMLKEAVILQKKDMKCLRKKLILPIFFIRNLPRKSRGKNWRKESQNLRRKKYK